MAIIQFANGQRVSFNGQPTPADIEELSSQMGIAPQPAQEAPNPYGAAFRATGNETGTQAGLKAAGNLPSSALNFGKGLVDIVTNPVQTAKGIGGAITDVGRTVTNKISDVTGIKQIGIQGSQATPTLGSLEQVLKDRYGSLENAQRTAIEDPFGVGADIAGILSGGAVAAGKTAQLGNVASKAANVATAPVRVPVRAATNAAGKATGFGVSQLTGLSPETLSTVTRNAGAFSDAKAAGTTRVDLAQDVFGAINKASDELSDLGKGYDTVRTSGQVVSLPDDWLKGAVEKFKLKLQYDNKPPLVNGLPDTTQPVKATVVADRASQTRNTTDLNKIQSFVDNWGGSKNFTAEEYLNMRHDLGELAKYDQAGSDVARKFATNLREGTLNSDTVRNQVDGLKDLDAIYSKDVQFYNKIRKDFLDANGNLKDGAASKVVNSITAANPERLARIEKIYPGFTQQAKVVKALEDVENSMGLKVGTYARAGAGITGIATGNIPLIITAILATPEIAIPLLQGLGLSAQKITPILKAVRDAANDINNFRAPGALQQYLNEKYPDGVPVGLSTQSVSISGKNADVAEKFIDHMEGVSRVKGQELIDLKAQAQSIAEGVGIDPVLGDKALANALRRQLDNQNFAKKVQLHRLPS
jgi:hypothetical protein